MFFGITFDFLLFLLYIYNRGGIMNGRYEYDEQLERRLRGQSLSGESGRRTREKYVRMKLKDFKKRLAVFAATIAVATSLLIGGISNGIHAIQDNMVIGSMVHQFHIDCINPETHRTMDNEHYYYDYDDIAHYIENMGDFDVGLYLFNRNTNDYQTERVLQYTDYETMDEYLALHNWESTDQWRDDMRDRILVQHEVNDRQAELAQMNEEHRLEDAQVTTLGGAK